MSIATTVTEAVTTRRSIRNYLDKPVDLETIRRVMEKARWSASGCNYQPWEASILTGQPLKDLQAKIIADGPQAAEYDWAAPGTEEAYKKRLDGVSAGMFGAMGIARDDGAGRMAAMAKNAVSFDAPAVLFVYFPRLMKEPQWSDVGMWLQTVALLLREEGLDSCIQEFTPTRSANFWGWITNATCSSAAWRSATAIRTRRSTISSASACRWTSRSSSSGSNKSRHPGAGRGRWPQRPGLPQAIPACAGITD
jgi:nitroreductase